jgi:hypothetical protein
VRITRQKLNDIIENEVRLMLTEPAPLELDEDLPAPETEAGLRYELSKTTNGSMPPVCFQSC